MKKRTLFLLGLLCLCLTFSFTGLSQSPSQPLSLAEPKGSGKISGLLTDSLTGKPVEYVTVALLHHGTTHTVDGTLSDSRGHFVFSRLSPGTYDLTFSFVGYHTKTILQVTISKEEPEAVVGAVALSQSATQLREVTVVGQKPLIEDKIDRLVYNADQDLTNTGGNAADVLQKVPSLSVDAEGNVQMRGSGNVRVLLNGKASTILATNLADALKQIPSDQIKSVEVMTTPPAKYDAEGTAGIINIITKKSSLPGLHGNTGLTVGNQNSSIFSNTSLHQGKVGVNLNLSSFRYSVPKGYGMYRREKTEGGELETRQTGEGRVYGGGATAQLGLEYDLDSVNLFSAGVRLNTGSYRGLATQETTTSAPGPFAYIHNTTRNKNAPFSTDVNLEYTHIFKPKQELTLLAQYSKFNLESFVHQNRLTQEDQLFYLQHNTNQSMNQETTLQADYTQPLPHNATVEAGAKAIFRRARSNAQYDIHYPLENRAAPEENIFQYAQDVVAGYLSYGLTFGKKYAVKVGARYEHTRLSGDFTSTHTLLDETYQNLIPSFVLSRNLKENQTLKISYTQRLQRPHIFLLNPYRDNRDPKSIFFGNPKLDPELTHLYEIGYSTFFKTSSVSTALYLRQINNAIQQVTLGIEEGVAQNTFENAGKLLSYGLNVSGSTKPVPAWSLSGSLNLYYNRLSGLGTGNTGWQYNLNLSSGYDFGHGLSAQFSGGFNSRRVVLQGYAYATGYHSLAVKKELFHKKGSVSLGVNNPFTRYINAGQEISTDSFFQTNDHVNYNRSVRMSFDYKFGQQSGAKPPRKKKSIRNDDLKQGD